jgi:hypothetical protein
MTVFQSRWGFHPCDYETFQLLKRLHALFEHARRRFAEWKRWKRKLPHNRVLRRVIRDAAGRKVGTEVIGPRPEPELSPVFCERLMIVRGGAPAGERVRLLYEDLPEAYREARRPKATSEEAKPLRYSAETLRELLRHVEGRGT